MYGIESYIIVLVVVGMFWWYSDIFNNSINSIYKLLVQEKKKQNDSNSSYTDTIILDGIWNQHFQVLKLLLMSHTKREIKHDLNTKNRINNNI